MKAVVHSDVGDIQGVAAAASNRSPAPWREFLAGALPGIVAAVGFFWLFSDQGRIERMIQSLIGGLLFSAFAFIALFLVDHLVSRIAGQPTQDLDLKNSTVRAACALIIFVWFLGHSWVRTNDAKMMKCLTERAEIADYGREPWKMQDVVDYCRDQLHQESASSYGDDY